MIQPIGDRVLVRQLEKEKASTVILVQEAEGLNLLPKGTVLAVGNGLTIQSSSLSVGDTVLFTEYAGERVGEKDSRLLLLNLNDVLGKEDSQPTL